LLLSFIGRVRLGVQVASFARAGRLARTSSRQHTRPRRRKGAEAHVHLMPLIDSGWHLMRRRRAKSWVFPNRKSSGANPGGCDGREGHTPGRVVRPRMAAFAWGAFVVLPLALPAMPRRGGCRDPIRRCVSNAAPEALLVGFRAKPVPPFLQVLSPSRRRTEEAVVNVEGLLRSARVEKQRRLRFCNVASDERGGDQATYVAPSRTERSLPTRPHACGWSRGLRCPWRQAGRSSAMRPSSLISYDVRSADCKGHSNTRRATLTCTDNRTDLTSGRR
jgi:hypothetical protein